MKKALLKFLNRPSLLKVTGILLTFPFLLVSLWSISYGFTAGYFGLVIIGMGCFYLFKKQQWRYILGTLAMWCLMNLLMVVNTGNHFNNTNDRYYAKVENGKGLTLQEKVNVYGSNILMGFIAYPLFPEAGKETILMMFPTKKGVRYEKNDFFFDSRKIKKEMQSHPKQKVFYISWKASEYLDYFGEARPALALNACVVRRIGNHKYSAEVPVRYPYKYKTLLVPFPSKIYIQEAMSFS
jgi:hypothetical protein